MHLISYQIKNSLTKIDLASDNDDAGKRIQIRIDTAVVPEPIAVAADALFAHLCKQYALNAWNFTIRKGTHPQLGVQFVFSYNHWLGDIHQASTTIPNISNELQMQNHWRWLENMLCEHYQGLVRMTDLQLALAF